MTATFCCYLHIKNQKGRYKESEEKNSILMEEKKNPKELYCQILPKRHAHRIPSKIHMLLFTALTWWQKGWFAAEHHGKGVVFSRASWEIRWVLSRGGPGWHGCSITLYNKITPPRHPKQWWIITINNRNNHNNNNNKKNNTVCTGWPVTAEETGKLLLLLLLLLGQARWRQHARVTWAQNMQAIC